MSPLQSIYETFIKKETFKDGINDINNKGVTCFSPSGFTPVQQPWDNTGLKDVEVGLDGNLTVHSKFVQIVVWVVMLGVGKWNTSCTWLVIIVFVTFVHLTDAYTTFELGCQVWYFESVPWLLFFQLEALLEEDNHNQEAQQAPLNSLGWDLHKLGRQKVVSI